MYKRQEHHLDLVERHNGQIGTRNEHKHTNAGILRSSELNRILRERTTNERIG